MGTEEKKKSWDSFLSPTSCHALSGLHSNLGFMLKMRVNQGHQMSLRVGLASVFHFLLLYCLRGHGELNERSAVFG